MDLRVSALPATSLGLMRGNATMLVCRCPDGDHPSGEVDVINVSKVSIHTHFPF